MDQNSLTCHYAPICSGCSWLHLSDEKQLSLKAQDFIEKWTLFMGEEPPPLRTARVPDTGFRDRVDLVFENGNLSFYQKKERTTFEMQNCPLLSSALSDWFHELRKLSWPIRKGSLRLRVSPKGLRGVWLDFANEDVKNLFTEEAFLKNLLLLGHVEIGQRRKTLIFEDRLRLMDPQYHPWVSTHFHDKQIPLMSLVGGFSQTGDAALKLISERLLDHLTEAPQGLWYEFGPGNGSLTLPLALSGRSVHGFDVDDRSLEGLQKTLQAPAYLKLDIKLSAGDFQFKKNLSFEKVSGLLVNPPRSGLKQFLDPLADLDLSARPQTVIYLSCFLDSFLMDAKKLKELGYRLQKIDLIDQFPHTPHAEFLGTFSRSL